MPGRSPKYGIWSEFTPQNLGETCNTSNSTSTERECHQQPREFSLNENGYLQSKNSTNYQLREFAISPGIVYRTDKTEAGKMNQQQRTTSDTRIHL